MDCLRDMWLLQNIEVEMVRLRKEWEELKELLSKEQRDDLQEIEAAIAQAREDWKLSKSEFEQIVEQIEQINRSITQYEQQLYGEGGQSKELLSIQDKIDQLTKRKSILEDKQLEKIEILDRLEAKITSETCRLQRLSDHSISRINRLKECQQKTGTKYNELRERRTKLREEIPSHMLAVYNRLVAQKKRPVALLNEDSCSACGMLQTVLNVNALKKSGQYIRCNSCGRILILEKEINKEIK